MKIAALIFCSFEALGGVEVFTLNLLAEFVREGHDVTLFVTDNGYKKLKSCSFPFRIKSLPFKTYRLALLTPWFLGLIFRLVQKLEQFDVWQIMGVYPAAYAARLLQGHVPLVVRAHGEDVQAFPSFGYGHRLTLKIERKICKGLRAVDRAVALTGEIADCYEELGMRGDQIAVIGNGLRKERFERFRARQPHFVVGKKVRFLTVGRYHEKKGYAHIPCLAMMLRDSGVDFEWTVVGKGVDALAKEIARLGVKENVSLMTMLSGNISAEGVPSDELLAVYEKADMIIFPTYIEGFSMAILEAMWARIPIVSSACKGVQSVLQHERSGFLAKTGDLNDIVDGVLYVLSDNVRALRMVENAYSVAQAFSISNIAQKYITVYEDICGR